MGNSEGSLSRKDSKKEIDRRSNGSHKGTPKKKGIMKESLSRSNIYEYERSSSAKNSPAHSQHHEQSGILGVNKEASHKSETSNKTSKNKNQVEELKSTEMKKLSYDSEEEKESLERSRSPRSPERSQTPKSYDRSESPRSPMRNVDQSDQESNVSVSHSDDDDDDNEDARLRKHNNHLPSFIKPENKVLPTVVPVKPLHQTEFGAILQQGGSITRKKHQEQKEAELKRLEMLYEQARLQEYSLREQYWSMPNIPPADYDIPPPDYDDMSEYEDIKKSKKKSKSNQKDKIRNSFYSSPVRDQREGQYAWDSETEWYVESKPEKKKKKEKENKGKKGMSLLHRTESVNESSSPKKEKKKKPSKRSISLGPGESSLRDKWKNAAWLSIKKKENKTFDENTTNKKKNPIRKSNEMITDEWRNPNNPYTADVHPYHDEKQTMYYEKSFSKQTDRAHHDNEYYKSENQRNVKSKNKRIPELENTEESIEKNNELNWRQKEQTNTSHRNQIESDSDNYQKKSASGFSERVFRNRYSPQKVDAATSTTLDDVKLPPPRKKGKKKNSMMQDENLDRSNNHHKMQSSTKLNLEETYEKGISSDEDISQKQKQRFHQSSVDINQSPEYKHKDFTSSRSSHDLYREEDNSIKTEVKHSFENVISEMNYGANEKKQEIIFGSTHSARTGHNKIEKISPAIKNLKERNEHLQEEKIKEIRARSPSPWNENIEMHLRPTIPKREFKMPPNFSPNQTWKSFIGQTSDNEELHSNSEDIQEKIEKVVHPSMPARNPKVIAPRIEKETSSSSDGDIDLYQGFDKQYSSRKENWIPDQDLLDDIEPEINYRKASPIAHSPQPKLSMPSSMFSSKQNYSRSPISRVSPRQEDSSDSSSKRNSISRIKESVKHAVGLKNKMSAHHLDPNWSLVKSNSSEDERDYREFSRKSEQKEKYMFGDRKTHV